MEFFYLPSVTLYPYMEALYCQILWTYVPAIFFYMVVSYDFSWLCCVEEIQVLVVRML